MHEGPMSISRRSILFAALGGAGALTIGACGGSASTSSRSAGPVTLAADVDVSKLAPLLRPTLRTPDNALGFPSPFASNAGPGYNQMILLYDTLLWKDGIGQLLPWLAKSYNLSADHLTYTLEMRPDVKWSDGKPLTSDDVKFTFDYYAEMKTLGPPIVIQPPQGIASVSVRGDSTVEIKLTSPQVTFADLVLGALPIIPRHIWSGIKRPEEELDTKILVGSGPYRLESYKGSDEAMLYVAKDDYFLGRPFVKRIELHAVDPSAAFSALLAGSTDVARGFGLRPDILAPFERDPAYSALSAQGLSTNALYWNLGKEGALSDPRFRRACAMGIDRNDMVKRLAGGRGLPGSPGFLSSANPYYAPVPQYEFDVAGANALLDSAGYRPAAQGGIRRDSKGAPLSFELRIDNVQAPMSEVLISSMKHIGVELRQKAVAVGPDLFGSKFVGDFDMVVLPFPGPSPGGPGADPDVLRRLYSSNLPPSLAGAATYVNPAFDALADKQRETFDESQRKAIVAQMQKIIADDLPILPLFYPDATLVYRKAVLDQWSYTPGVFPAAEDNKQLFVTGLNRGSNIRPTR